MYSGYYNSSPQLGYPGTFQHVQPPGSFGQIQPPLTPLDLSYGQSMLPSNLMASPYFQLSSTMVSPRQLSFTQPNPAYHPMHSHGRNQPHSPYLTSLPSNSNLDQLNLSRTIILKYLSPDLSLNELLSEIDYGPVEYCKMFTKEAPAHFKDIQYTKTCYISFVNSKISINFHLKYAKNNHNLNKLKEKLKNSKYLKISFNEGPNNANNNAISKQDYIKLKTLNYIVDFNATRCLLISFDSSDSTMANAVETSVRNASSKFGEIEDFRVSYEESIHQFKVTVHFTSIDAAIKTYELLIKKIELTKREQLERENDESNTPLFKLSSVEFNKDRCDRTVIDKVKQRNTSTSSLNSYSTSPASSKKFYSNGNGVPENIEESVDSLSEQNLHQLTENIANAGNDDDDESTNISILSDNPPLHPYSSHPHLASMQSIPMPVSTPNGIPAAPVPGAVPYNMVPQNKSSAYQYNPDPFNVGNRTIYLGNLHPNTTIEEIANNVRAGGLVESIKYHPEKRICFITFVDAMIALKFYLNHQVLHQLIVHGYDITVGWAKNHSGPVHRDISLAVTAGASRNVYIGVKAAKDKPDDQKKMQLPTEETLRKDFSKFGELEQINFYHNKDCGFMNFLNIADAIQLVEAFESGVPSKVSDIVGDNGEFFEFYKNFKISFAKDRCGNPPKFSFKKKLGGAAQPYAMNGSFESPDYTNFKMKKRSQVEKYKTAETVRDEPIGDILPEETETEKKHEAKEAEDNPVITEEAAMVFGIISNNEATEVDREVSPGCVPQENGTLKNEKKLDREVSPGCIPEADGEKEGLGIVADKEDEEYEDDDDDDDVSIIIGSDQTSTSPPHIDRKKKYQDHSRKYSRNSSNVSLNSNYMKYYNQPKYPNSPYFHPQAFPQPYPQHPSAYSGQQQMYYVPGPPQARSRVNSSGSSSGYFGMMAAAPPPPPPNQPYYFPNQQKNAQLTSGSQVMAQYLAKSQHDNLLYAATILSHDVSVDEDQDYALRSSDSGRQESKD